MSRQSGAVESCHTQWSVSVISLYKQVRKINSTLWQCHRKESYIICKPSEQWTVPQWSLYFYCKKMHLICDAGGGGTGRLLIFSRKQGKLKFRFTTSGDNVLKKKKKKKRDTTVVRLNRTPSGTQVRMKWRRTHPRALKKLLGVDGQVLFTSWDLQSSKAKPWGLTQLQLLQLLYKQLKHRNVEMFCGQPWQRTTFILIICNALKLLCSHFCVQQLSVKFFLWFFSFLIILHIFLFFFP